MSQQSERESIMSLLGLICRAQRSQLNAGLAEIGIYAGQEAVLWELSRQDGLSQSHLVERMCVQPPTVSKMLDRMEISGLVRRSPDTEDSRISRVYLTEQGHNNLQGVRDIWIGLEQRLTDNLTIDEQVLLRRLLLQVHENLSREP